MYTKEVQPEIITMSALCNTVCIHISLERDHGKLRERESTRAAWQKKRNNCRRGALKMHAVNKSLFCYYGLLDLECMFSKF